MNIGLHHLFLKHDADSRSISAENPRGQNGKGRMTLHLSSIGIKLLSSGPPSPPPSSQERRISP